MKEGYATTIVNLQKAWWNTPGAAISWESHVQGFHPFADRDRHPGLVIL